MWFTPKKQRCRTTLGSFSKSLEVLRLSCLDLFILQMRFTDTMTRILLFFVEHVFNFLLKISFDTFLVGLHLYNCSEKKGKTNEEEKKQLIPN